VYQRILVGTDGSPTAAKAVERAVDVARATGAVLTIACAGDAPRATEIVEAEAARHADAGIELATEVLDGDPATALLDRAEFGQFDLLVVGNKGMTGMARFMVGSVPNKVSHHAPCSILIARTT
jgi:nucleotide-binding universal stress UspA family protein